MMTLNKRGKRLIFLILFLMLSCEVYKLIPKNYTLNYKIDNYNIEETYLKKDKMYIFKMSKNKKTYETISTNKYTFKRKLITKIKEYSKDNISCIVIDSKRINNNILCLDDNERIDYNLTDILPEKYYTKYKENNKKYNNIDINLVDNTTYLVWNYKEFYKINKETLQTIKLFKNDVYNIDILSIIDKYLIMADYNQKYNYNKLIRINLENNKIDEIELNEDISFDSKIIGDYKNNIYILDEKNKKEYEINIKKKNMSIVSKNNMGKILQNGKWNKIKINKIITNDIIFNSDYYNTYKIIDNTLYMYQKNVEKGVKISNKDIKKIVYFDDEQVYYIVGQELYKYDYEHGETMILNYFELNFNYENMIYIYN